MEPLEQLRARQLAETREYGEKTGRARRAVRLLLHGQPPQEGEDYRFWKPQMTRLLQAFEQGGAWGVQMQLATMLHERGNRAPILLQGAVASDGRL